MQGRKPTRYEWPILERNNLDTRKWLRNWKNYCN